MPWKTYLGARTPGREPAVVIVDHTGEGFILPPRRDLADFANQFSWGTGEAGCAQLAFAILFDHFKDARLAHAWCFPFKNRVIVEIPQHDSWEISSQDIDLALIDLRGELNACRISR